MNPVKQVHVHALPTFNTTNPAWLLQDVVVVHEVRVWVRDGVIECVSLSVSAIDKVEDGEDSGEEVMV